MTGCMNTEPHIVLYATQRRQTQVKLRKLSNELPGGAQVPQSNTQVGQRAASTSNVTIQELCCRSHAKLLRIPE